MRHLFVAIPIAVLMVVALLLLGVTSVWQLLAAYSITGGAMIFCTASLDVVTTQD